MQEIDDGEVDGTVVIENGQAIVSRTNFTELV